MFWRKKRPLSDFSEEIQSHLAHEADVAQGTGEAREDAEAKARRTFGNITIAEEKFYERGRLLFWDRFTRDVRLGLRLLLRRPAFSAVIVLTLALGIGSNTAIFSVINAVLLRPLPYKEPGRLAMLWSEDSLHDLHEQRVSLQNFADWRNRSQAFESMTVFVPQTFLLGSVDGQPPERMRSARVSADFFPLLGVEPVIGRVFTREEEASGEPVVILSHALWQEKFGGATQTLGSDLVMDGRKLRIIGVMPASFQYPFKDTVVWEPMTAHPYWVARDRDSLRSFSVWYALGRIRSEIPWVQAQSEMSVIGRQLAEEHPESRNLPEIQVVPLYTQTTGHVQFSLILLFSSVCLILLIACANVVNLLLARGSSREREFTMRRALGAGRGALVAQLLTESLVLSTAGGLLGLGLAAVALKAIVHFGPRDFPRLAEAHIDVRVLLFTVLLCLFAATASALWPAMKTGSAAGPSRRGNTAADRVVRKLLVISEFAIALILLIGAGLMVRSFVRLENVDTGFRPENLLVMRIDLHVGKKAAQQVAYFEDVIARVQTIPGVRMAGAVSGFARTDPEDSVEIEGRLPQQPGPCKDSVAGPFFATAGISLKKGRFFSSLDRANSPPVAIINETMARTFWPTEDPIGKRFRFPGERANAWISVVGVTGDMRREGLENRVAPQIFRPETQETDDMLDVIVRTASDPLVMASSIQSEAQAIDKTVAKFKIETVDQQLKEQTAARRFQTSLIGLFSILALTLSAIGIYGLLHYFVTQRTNEIGVRVALGARSANVLALVLREGLTLAGIGIALGILGALGLTRLLSGFLFGVSSTDPATFIVAPAILLVVAVVACAIPARRAAGVDPMVALRQE